MDPKTVLSPDQICRLGRALAARFDALACESAYLSALAGARFEGNDHELRILRRLVPDAAHMGRTDDGR